uniref:Tegument protein UL43 n=1 Tax=Human betaherpesvirus 6A TaxID=32603 RepID=A0A219XZK2_9BETA|nr:tegument protein UL43 [Human betaherpesvirus 6A]
MGLSSSKDIDLLVNFIENRQGATLALPWPEDYRLTLHSVENIPEISREDVQNWAKTYMCCGGELVVVGVIHKAKTRTCRGPIVLQGARGHIYVYNGFFDRSLYHVASSFHDLFSNGLRFFYPIYETCDYALDSTVALDMIAHSKSFSELLHYRNERKNAFFTLKTYPYKTFVRFCNLSMTEFSSRHLIQWRRKLQTSLLDVVFIVQHNFFGDWRELVVVFDGHGMLFCVDREESLLFIARNMSDFLKIGCLRYNENRRLHTQWFTQDTDYIKQVDEMFSRDVLCPLREHCQRSRRERGLLKICTSLVRGINCIERG